MQDFKLKILTNAHATSIKTAELSANDSKNGPKSPAPP